MDFITFNRCPLNPYRSNGKCILFDEKVEKCEKVLKCKKKHENHKKVVKNLYRIRSGSTWATKVRKVRKSAKSAKKCDFHEKALKKPLFLLYLERCAKNHDFYKISEKRFRENCIFAKSLLFL